MPHLYSFGQHKALAEIKQRLHPDDLVVAFLDASSSPRPPTVLVRLMASRLRSCRAAVGSSSSRRRRARGAAACARRCLVSRSWALTCGAPTASRPSEAYASLALRLVPRNTSRRFWSSGSRHSARSSTCCPALVIHSQHGLCSAYVQHHEPIICCALFRFQISWTTAVTMTSNCSAPCVHHSAILRTCAANNSNLPRCLAVILSWVCARPNVPHRLHILRVGRWLCQFGASGSRGSHHWSWACSTMAAAVRSARAGPFLRLRPCKRRISPFRCGVT